MTMLIVFQAFLLWLNDSLFDMLQLLQIQVFHFKLVLLGDASVGKSCGQLSERNTLEGRSVGQYRSICDLDHGMLRQVDGTGLVVRFAKGQAAVENNMLEAFITSTAHNCTL